MKRQGNKCIGCSQYKSCKDSSASWIFFVVGIIATIAVRVVTVLMYIDPIYGKLAWYIGVGGFVIFFIYRFNVTQDKARLIKKNDLLEKVALRKDLKDQDYDLIQALLCGLTSRKEKINYLFIFILSALALLLAFYIDFFK